MLHPSVESEKRGKATGFQSRMGQPHRVMGYRSQKSTIWEDHPIHESMLLSYNLESSVRIEAPFCLKLSSDLSKPRKTNEPLHEQSPTMPWTELASGREDYSSYRPEAWPPEKWKFWGGSSAFLGPGLVASFSVERPHPEPQDGQLSPSEPSRGRGTSLAESFREGGNLVSECLPKQSNEMKWEEISTNRGKNWTQ